MNEQSKVAAAILSASSYKPGSRNWTVLNVYRDPAEAEPFTIEIVGETRVPGQVRRVRRRSFATLAKALNWNMLDFASPLYDELRERALEFVEAGGLYPQALICSGTLSDEAVAEIRASRPGEVFLVSGGQALPVNRIGFTAPADRPLEAAIRWLYEGEEYPNDEAHEFCRDFGMDRQALDTALEFEAGQSELPRCTARWIDLFVASLRFFDREAFHANRA